MSGFASEAKARLVDVAGESFEAEEEVWSSFLIPLGIGARFNGLLFRLCSFQTRCFHLVGRCASHDVYVIIVL